MHRLFVCTETVLAQLQMPLLPLCCHIGSYVSTRGLLSPTVVLLPVRPLYHGTLKHYTVEHVLFAEDT